MFINYSVIFCEGKELEIQEYLMKSGFSWYNSSNRIRNNADVLIIDSEMEILRFKKINDFQIQNDNLCFRDSIYKSCIYGSSENWQEDIDDFIKTPPVTARNLKRELSKNPEHYEVVIMIGDKEYKICDIEDITNKVVLICEEN